MATWVRNFRWTPIWKSYHLFKWSHAVRLGSADKPGRWRWVGGLLRSVGCCSVLRNDKKNTDNSSEAQSCLFLRPTCLKCSCLALVGLKSCRICSKRLLSFSQVQHTDVHGYVRADWFKLNFKSCSRCAWWSPSDPPSIPMQCWLQNA